MFRRILPLFILLLTLLVDTAILPVFYHGAYSFPLSLAVVMITSVLLGWLQGILWGLISGLLIDITVGTTGVMAFGYMALGFLAGLILDESQDTDTSFVRMMVWRAVVIFALYFIAEGVYCAYRYFMTASFEWIFVARMAVRSILFTAFTFLITPLLSRLYRGRSEVARTGRRTRNL